MDPEEMTPNNGPLTVNEQVIVMSGHETIRVLEVEVDASLQGAGADGKRQGAEHSPALESSEGGPEEAPVQPGGTGTAAPADREITLNSATLGVQTVAPAAPSCIALSQAHTAVPITMQACPQLLSQDGLTTVVTGMMTQAGALSQPLLIPFTMAGQVGGQPGLAVLTFPTATVATLPGLTAASPAGGVLKLPFTGLQAATVLNTVQPQLHAAAQTILQPQMASQQQQQPQTTQPGMQINTTTAATTVPASVATLQTAGISINPAIISAASLGAQPQFISSLATTPIITSAISGMQGITSQIITNAQGQVIGTLPFLVNPASLAAASAAPPTLPTQSLQVQTVAPQLVLNAQGQIIATIGNGPSPAPVLTKSSITQTPAKPASQGTVVTGATVSQAPVIIAPQPPAVKTVTTISSPLPITCGDSPTVGQLVSKPQQPGADEEGINLEEIREFAKNFKIRRLSLGLTQTQVGQALTATEGPAYSQSAICRFEKLDITPKSAQKLKPVLEKWLAEAELWNQKGQQNLMEFVGGEPSKKRKRRTSFTPQAIEVLNTYFEKNALPTGQEITEIAKELNYDREVVRVWFCNRRQTLKNTSKLNVFQIQ